MKCEPARLTIPRLSPPQEFPCPNCHAAKQLRGSRTFGSVTCAACGAQWRPREEVGGYRLHEQLARGGFSLIFRASNPAGGDALAVKIFALPFGFTSEDAERFRDEVRILAAYDHPHWLRIFGGGVEEDFAWLAMEWLPQGSLAQCGPLAENEALQIAAQIADALVAAHSCGLQHRNLQLGECLRADAHTVKVSGFAEAALYECAGLEVGTVWGHLSDTPPERFFEEPEDARSEIYALGAILFQLLTGELPYEGETMPEIFQERLEGPSPRVRDYIPAIRESTTVLLDQMLAVDPRDRFSSWEETAAALGPIIRAATPATRAVPVAVERPVLKTPIHSPAGGAWFTIVMLAGIVGIAGWFGWKHWQKPLVEPAVLEPKVIAISTPQPTTPAPVVAPIVQLKEPPRARPKAARTRVDWTPWKKFLLESPQRLGTSQGSDLVAPDGSALRLSGNNSGMAGGHDENVFFARQMEGNWDFSARVRANNGPAGIVAREGLGSDRPCVGIFLSADGKLNSVLRTQPAARLKPTPVHAGSRWLRIVRRGPTMSAFHSSDGKHWREAATLHLSTLPSTVPVGFVVWSGGPEKQAEATFEEIALTPAR